MKKLILPVILMFIHVIHSQTFNGVGGPIIQTTYNQCNGPNDVGNFTIAVSGVGNSSRLKNIKFNISHPSDEELGIWLVSPTGKKILIVDNEGGYGDNFAYTTISYDGTQSIADGFPPYSGIYRATYLSNFEIFNGIDLNGTWKLKICDDNNNEYSGTLDDWSITFFTPDGFPDNAVLETASASVSYTNNVMIYGNVYKAGLTDVTTAPTAINAWVGYSTTNTTPNTWGNWVPAVFNQNVGDSDQYKATIGRNLAPGTYYYAIKFKIEGADYCSYGGTNGGFWDGITHNNGILTVTPAVIPINDDTCNAIPLTVNPDYSCAVITQGTTTAGTPSPIDGSACWGEEDDDVWYSFVATTTSHKIGVFYDDPNVSGNNLQYSLWTNADCNYIAFVPGSCSSATVSIASGLVIGQKYYLRIYTSNANGKRAFDVCIGTEPTPPNLVTLEPPSPITIPSQSSIVIKGQIYKAGLTDTFNGQVPGIFAWIGLSSTNTNPATAGNWVWQPAVFNTQVGDRDEYKVSIGPGMVSGTYYYAMRFQQHETNSYYYGGINSDGNGGFWDGTAYKNGILTISSPVPPVNDNCSGAIPLTVGHYFSEFITTGKNYSATDTAITSMVCNGTPLNVNSNIWYTAIIPDSGHLIIEARRSNSVNSDHTLMTYTGSCGSFTEVSCGHSSSGGTSGNSFTTSRAFIHNQPPGTIIYIAVLQKGNYLPTVGSAPFRVSAYWSNYLLEVPSYEFEKFTYFPNPVTDFLTLSNDNEIIKVEIFNMLGQSIRSNIVNSNEAKVNMADLSKGVYLVRIFCSNQTKVLKVLKE